MIGVLLALALGCGEERWAQKTLADGFAPDGGAAVMTVAQLVAHA